MKDILSKILFDHEKKMGDLKPQLDFSCEYFHVLKYDKHKEVSFRNVDNNSIEHNFRLGAQQAIGSRIVQQNSLPGQRYNLMFMVKNITKIDSYLKEQHGVTLEECEFTREFMEYAKNEMAPIEEARRNRLANGVVEFEDLMYFYNYGDHVIFSNREAKFGGVVKKTEYQIGYFGDMIKLTAEVIYNSSGMAQKGNKVFMIYEHKGVIPISSLMIKHATTEDKDKLSSRLSVFQELNNKSCYLRYTGELTQVGWFGSVTPYRAEGRVMVDPRGFNHMDPDRFAEESRSFNIESENGRRQNPSDGPNETVIVEPNDAWRIYPYVLGFSFRAKKWGAMNLDKLYPISWNNRAFDLLVMDETDKNMIRALVEHSAGAFTDIVDEKGGGTIILLEGSPGQGKTLTAESVAEMSHKPLYSVSVGELGTDPVNLESSLRTILDVATRWDAVILIDEADIFLEKRDTSDIVRNAMVGVFLRLLEYHNGTLFLTTNRVKQLDPAFFSRISVALSFPEATHEKRVKVWQNILLAAKIDLSTEDVHELANYNVNSRQIKNAIRLGLVLAHSQGRKNTLKGDLMQPLGRAEEFARSIER